MVPGTLIRGKIYQLRVGVHAFISTARIFPSIPFDIEDANMSGVAGESA